MSEPTIGIQLGETVAAIQEAGNRLIQLVHGQTPSAGCHPQGLTHEPASVDLLLDDERFDGIENGDVYDRQTEWDRDRNNRFVAPWKRLAVDGGRGAI